MSVPSFVSPTDLQTIEKKITDQSYNKLSDFIGDMTKIFDNCRFYNPKESSFYRCAESLEGFFVQRIKTFREALTSIDATATATTATATETTAKAKAGAEATTDESATPRKTIAS